MKRAKRKTHYITGAQGSSPEDVDTVWIACGNGNFLDATVEKKGVTCAACLKILRLRKGKR